jgi:Interleukin-like EMT inducer
MSLECRVDLLTFGFEDIIGHLTATGYIKINGIQWLKTWTFTYRGFNFVEVNVDNCASTNNRTFDTCGSTSQSDAMVTYINSLQQPTVLIGVVVDEGTKYLTTAARNTLKGIGLDMSNLTYQGKATFVTQIGNPSASVVKIAPRFGDNLRSTVAVRCTYELKVKILHIDGIAICLTA